MAALTIFSISAAETGSGRVAVASATALDTREATSSLLAASALTAATPASTSCLTSAEVAPFGAAAETAVSTNRCISDAEITSAGGGTAAFTASVTRDCISWAASMGWGVAVGAGVGVAAGIGVAAGLGVASAPQASVTAINNRIGTTTKKPGFHNNWRFTAYLRLSNQAVFLIGFHYCRAPQSVTLFPQSCQ